MSERAWIRQGDTSTAGGLVQTTATGMRQAGLYVAFEGDAVACPACDRIGIIKCAGSRAPCAMNGRELALEGDLCICGCWPPPVLVATQRTATSEGASSSNAGPVAGGVDAFVAGRAPTSEEDAFDRRFVVQDEAGGAPLVNRLYRLSYPGGVVQGRTDESGFTEPVSGLEGDEVRIEVFGEEA